MMGYVDALQQRLLQRFDLRDADFGEIVSSKLQLEALQAAGEELNNSSQAETIAWLVKKVAVLEARVHALAFALHERETQAHHGNGKDIEPPVDGLSLLSLAPSQSVSVEMDENVIQEGFYAPERTKEEKPFRWLGPNPIARVYVQKSKKPLDLKLHVNTAFKGVELEAVRVALNGGTWATAEVKRAGAAYVLSFRPEPGSDDSGLTDYVDIDCGVTYSPASEGGTDKRKLGIALARIEMVGA